MAEFVVRSPFDGWAAPLAETPDAVFADGMLGDGVSVDPTSSRLLSPVDGEVVSVPQSGHAVSLRAQGGLELIVHVGVDTVRLGGSGFQAHVVAGQRVMAGDPLITVDLDRVAREAPSLMTPVVVTSPGCRIVGRSVDRLVVAGSPLFTVEMADQVDGAERQGAVVRRSVTVPLPHGIHARPAARIAASVKSLNAQVSMRLGDRHADVASPVALMSLGVRRDDIIELEAVGADAEAAVEAVATLIESGMGETAPHPRPAASAPAVQTVAPVVRREGEYSLAGTPASPGLALGGAIRLDNGPIEVREDGQGYETESEALQSARAAVRARLERQAESDPEHGAIFAAHAAFLEDPQLKSAAQRQLGAGASAGRAWRAAVGEAVEGLRRLGDPRMLERVGDFLDVERLVLEELYGGQTPPPNSLPDRAIVVADAMTPSQFVALDPARLAGLALAGGGPTSHVSILAAAAGVPALVAVGPELQVIVDGTELVLDADAGRLIVKPSATSKAAFERRLAERAAVAKEARRLSRSEARTRDNVRIKVYANLGSAGEAAAAVGAGAEGCGLLRTEFLFLERETAPDETEQHASYQAIADAMLGRPVIIRTLDAGADKPLRYLHQAQEENPALGLRGVRVSLARPELLRTQLRAILRVEPYGQCSIMLPMVVSMEEVRAVRAMLAEEAQALGRPGPLKLGVMIETPAAAILADRFSRVADFLSIGTNDLTQYVLAIDREHPQLAGQLDPLHPSVLRMIQVAAEGGRSAQFVGVCGGLASDPASAALLVGLGVTELSSIAGSIGAIKAALARVTLEQCRRLAREALQQDSAADVRAVLADVRRFDLQAEMAL